MSRSPLAQSVCACALLLAIAAAPSTKPATAPASRPSPDADLRRINLDLRTRVNELTAQNQKLQKELDAAIAELEKFRATQRAKEEAATGKPAKVTPDMLWAGMSREAVEKVLAGWTSKVVHKQELDRQDVVYTNPQTGATIRIYYDATATARTIDFE